MARRPEEQAAINEFVVHLDCETGLTWQPSAGEVQTSKNNRKYDCEFTCPGNVPIAAELCDLYPLGSHRGDQAKREKLIGRLRPEMVKAGLGGLMINLPPIEKKHVRPEWPRHAVAKIQETIQEQVADLSCPVDIEGLAIQRVADVSEDSVFVHSEFSGHQPIDAAGYPLAELLKNKHDQLDVDGHRRYLIVVNNGCRTHAVDVIAACAFIDFRGYPNFDRIYFQESPGRFQLSYDRRAYSAMETGSLPSDPEGCRLVARWIEVRLSGHWPGALDTALQISWYRHSTEWLSEAGRASLELEGQLFLQQCEWETPRVFWELFRGRVPRIADGRRHAQPIRVP